MRITVLGAGNIGGTIGQKWAARGHDVVFGVREPTSPKVQQLLDTMAAPATAAPVAGSLNGAEVVLLAIPGRAVEQTITGLGAHLNGKILIDATNNITRPAMNSLATLSAVAPGASLYRAFSNLGWENFAEPVIGGVRADLFYCGDESESRPVVDNLIEDVGLRPVYIGGIEQAALIDATTRLWFALQQSHGRHLAFKMLTE